MYINRFKMDSVLAICNLVFAITGFIAVVDILFMMFLLILQDMVLFIFFVFLLPIFLILSGIFAIAWFSKMRLYRADKYNRIFEEDHDGVIPYEALASLTGFNINRVKKDIGSLTGRNIFKNITFDRKGVRIVMKADTETDFITVDCPTCNAPVKMRVGGGARCDHCGTYMRSEIKDVH